MKFAVVLITLVASLAGVKATNYCSSTLCPKGTTHIVCGHSGAFSTSCPAGARLVNLTPYISDILNSHNTKRDLVASGKLSGYLAAKRMGTMQWDNELATIAAFNVKQCTMKHDQCRNTDAFKYSGQNLATFSYTGAETAYTDTYLIKNRIDAWFNEYSVAKMAYINSYPNSYSGPAIGHYTVMVADKNIRVGCAAARYKDDIWNQFLIACNYATTNIMGQPIYTSGTAAKGCTTGTHATYTSLCSTSETYTGL